jgi:hypothetical protein
MDYGISFLAGAIHKYYDDIQDNEADLSPLFLESIKVLMVTIMTINFMRIPSFSLFFILSICIYGILGRIDSDFWKACIPIPILTLIVNYSQFTYLGIFNIIQHVITIVLLGIFMYFEDILVPEETSIRKTASRIVVIVVFIFLLFLLRNISSFPFIAAVIFFSMGYLMTNILYHYDKLLDIWRLLLNNLAIPEISHKAT